MPSTHIGVGYIVEVSGLKSKPELNGLKAAIVEDYPDRNRYGVKFVEKPDVSISVKYENVVDTGDDEVDA